MNIPCFLIYLLLLFLVNLGVTKIIHSSFSKKEQNGESVTAGIVTGLVIGSVFSIIISMTSLQELIPDAELSLNMSLSMVFGMLSAILWRKL